MKRFWSKVDTSGDCWEWQAGRMPSGYGSFKLEGRTVYAHRLSYELANGRAPKDECVLHSCDNPGCVNPDHLFTGTQADNMRDMSEKGRAGVTSKISRNDAARIRSSADTPAELAARYALSEGHVRDIRAGKYWR